MLKNGDFCEIRQRLGQQNKCDKIEKNWHVEIFL